MQAVEAGEFVQMTSHESDAVIYCGDFNTETQDLPYKVLTQFYGLMDAQSFVDGPDLATCYAPENTYRHFDGPENARAKTIDYVFFKSPFKTEVCRPFEQVEQGRRPSGAANLL